MKHPRLTLGAVGGLLALVLGPFGVAVAGAAPKPHSDQVITVTKTAAGTGAALAGAVFTLYPWHGWADTSTVVAKATSDTNGRAVFSLVGHHNYWLVETAAPPGYELPTAAGKLVKTSHSTNAKGQDDRANLKESLTVGFVDAPKPSGHEENPPSDNQPVPDPATASNGATSSPTSPPAGSEVPGATTVHTGVPWAGSTPYAVGVGALGMSLVGTGLVLRRRQLHRLTS